MQNVGRVNLPINAVGGSPVVNEGNHGKSKLIIIIGWMIFPDKKLWSSSLLGGFLTSFFKSMYQM